MSTFKENIDTSTEFKALILWPKVFQLLLLHVLFVASGPVLILAQNATIFFDYLLILVAVLGVQLGAHRYYSHRSFQANFPLRLLMVICQTCTLQKDIYDWCRDHRVHHKYSETDADPHNSNRGFFFSHMGWLMLRKHPEVLAKGSRIDLSDVISDPLVALQRKYYYVLWVPIFWFLVPTIIPMYFWNESFLCSFFLAVIIRYTLTLHITFSVNSFAHAFGYRPYDRELVPVEASVRHALMGEGFHNYHHAFPSDYSASEFGPTRVFNPATAVIHFFASIGWAWNLKKPTPKLVAIVAKERGDNVKKDRYKEGAFNWIIEWTGGMAVMTSPLWIQLALKYGCLYLFSGLIGSFCAQHSFWLSFLEKYRVLSTCNV